MKTLRVGMVGLGLVSTSHWKGYASHEGAEVVALCDRDEERVRHFADRYAVGETYTDYDEMLDRAELDLVDIATPTFLHAPMAHRALERGIHVHCEKPFCRSVGEGKQLEKLARSRSVQLLVGETYVFISAHRKARQLIEDGAIGAPRQIRQRHGDWLERVPARIDTGPSDRSWRLDGRASGGGRYPWIFDHAVHFFATAEFFALEDPIEQVFALRAEGVEGHAQGGARHDPYAEGGVDVPIITWQHASGRCQGIWTRSERLNGQYDYRRGFSTTISGEKGMIEVLGEGGARLDWAGRPVHLVLHRAGMPSETFRFDEGGDDVWDSEIAYYSRGHVGQIHHLIDSVLAGTAVRYGAAQGTQAVRCTLATIRSAEEGIPIGVGDIEDDFTAY